MIRFAQRGASSARRSASGVFRNNLRYFASNPKIMYTKTDEAPMLATYSLLPIIKGFVKPFNVDVELRDISVAARVLSQFPECLTEEQKAYANDELKSLGVLCCSPEANVIKLPNISASVPQMKECIAELQAKGFAIPAYPESPSTPKEIDTAARYAKASGSAVNPVLREGNSDRRAPPAVKMYAKKFPHRMGAWRPSSKTSVAHMKDGDFFGNEQSVTMGSACTVRIEKVGQDGTVTVLKAKLNLLEGEILDSTFISMDKLMEFYRNNMQKAKRDGVLFSLHLKATMMKISDPIMFGAAVRVFFKPVYAKHQELLDRIGHNPNNGIGDLVNRLDQLSPAEREAVEKSMQKAYDEGPELAMVNSRKGITNLHVPSDVIVDASMPAMIREGGQMWDAGDQTRDTLAAIPDRTYAGTYDICVNFHRQHGAFDPSTMGSSANVGLMAQKAEEYGSHDKTFQLQEACTVRVVDAQSGKVHMEHQVQAGDVWRACQTKDAPIKDWVKLAVNRARASHTPAVFWLNKDRAHDAQVLEKVELYLKDHDLSDVDIRVMKPEEAMRFTLVRMHAGQDTISVTGNVLRDYNTDLFPILELGTSAKMLSVVPLMNGGGLFETGAGGSAPKHVQQFVQEGHLRWDSLGEFLAIAVSLEHIANQAGNKKIRILQKALDEANTHFLLNNRSPMRKVNQLDNRGSHFYLALYWAEALATQIEDMEIATRFQGVQQQLEDNRAQIINELSKAQGQPVDIGGYYLPDEAKVAASMRPSPTLNKIIDSLVL